MKNSSHLFHGWLKMEDSRLQTFLNLWSKFFQLTSSTRTCLPLSASSTSMGLSDPRNQINMSIVILVSKREIEIVGDLSQDMKVARLKRRKFKKIQGQIIKYKVSKTIKVYKHMRAYSKKTKN